MSKRKRENGKYMVIASPLFMGHSIELIATGIRTGGAAILKRNTIRSTRQYKWVEAVKVIEDE